MIGTDLLSSLYFVFVTFILFQIANISSFFTGLVTMTSLNYLRKKYGIIILVISVLIFVLIYQRMLDTLLANYTSLRLSNSTVYGAGCPENSFRQRLKATLQAWTLIASRKNITYFICYGALLGQHRDGEVIPFDNDIDACVFRNDLYKLEQEDEPKPFKPDDGNMHLIYQKHCHHPSIDTPRKTCKGKVVTVDVDQCTFLDPCARLILKPPTSEQTTWLDIFALRDNDTYLIDDWKRKTHKRDIIFPLKPCIFMGINTMCPNNVTGYLTRYYGSEFTTSSHYVCKNREWVANTNNTKGIAVPYCPEHDIFCQVNVFIKHMISKILG